MNINPEKVTAVVPARNCRRALAVCLAALCGGDCRPQIIVVDDASDDGTAQMVREKWPSAVLLEVPVHTGFAHAANLGLRLVRTEYALLIRPELQPGRSCVRKLLEALEPSARRCAQRERDGEQDPFSENGSAQAEQNPAAMNQIFCAVPRPSFRDRKSDFRAEITGSKSRRRFRRWDPAEVCGAPSQRHMNTPFGKTCSATFITLAVPDGCAMYRMKTLEEIGWLDERHFDGLEALDLSLRAALRGVWTVQVPGAHVRPVRPAEQGEPCNACGLPMDTFRRQLAAGNGIYILYKHLSVLPGFWYFRLAAAVRQAQRRSFGKRGEEDAFRMAQLRGKALCSLERERREALEHGVSVWAENLPDAAFLGMDKAAERVYPLFLAEKTPFSVPGIREALGIQELVRRSLPGILDQCTI